MQQISLHKKICDCSFQSQKGFSLIEILIAVAIMVSALIFVLPQINRSENQIKKSLRNIQAINRVLYSYSRINNRTYRLALNMDEQNPTYWVEVKKTMKEKEQEHQLKQESEDTPPVDLSHSQKTIPHPFFEKDQDLFPNEKKLPYKLYFEPAYPSKTGVDPDVLYVTYNPHAFSHSVTILIKKPSGFAWTLFFNPILGELEITNSEEKTGDT